MNKLKHLHQIIPVILIGLILLSCQKEDIKPQRELKLSQEISVATARKVALNFSKKAHFYNKPDKDGSNLKSSVPGFEEKEINEVILIPDENNSPSLYVVTFFPVGYVIISATLKESPILGYSEDAIFDFDKLPVGIAIWLVDRMDKIQILKKSDTIHIPDEVVMQWSAMAPEEGDGEVIVSGPSEYEQKGPLLTTLWGQKDGYNTSLDRIDGILPPTGCVATAMAQVMKYHKFPTSYNWTAMPDYYGTTATAQLMKDVGIAVDMEYGISASGAYTETAKTALKNTYGYSSSIQYVDYNVDVVVSELNSNRPVIMDAYHTYYTTSNGWWIFANSTPHYEDGHTWVCDGFKRTINTTIHNPETVYEYTTSFTSGYYLHMNWGASGTGMGTVDNNGWFKFDNFLISNGYNFQFRKKCIIGIKP